MDDVRILAKGRIDDLSKGFHLRDSLPFSIYLRSKTGVVENDTIRAMPPYMRQKGRGFPRACR